MTYHNPKPPKLTAAEKAEGKKWMQRVKMLPCAVCKAPPPSDVHHIIHGRYSQKRASDFDVIPLCKSHHQNGLDAIHERKETWRHVYGNDYDYLPWVKDMIEQQMNNEI